MGILWEAPNDSAEAEEQLSSFSEMGFSYLELEHPLSERVLSQAARYGFALLVRSNNTYFRVIDLRSNRNELLEEYIGILQQYENQPHVAGIGFFTQSQVYNETFTDLFSPVLDTLNSLSSIDFYFVNGIEWFNFKEPSQAFGKIHYTKNFNPQDLLDLNKTYTARNQYPAFIHFYHSQWLLQAIDYHPPLAESFKSYQETGTWQLPLPDIKTKSSSHSWLVFLLVLLWVILAIQVKSLPYIRPMILRYFFAHRFYVDDILHYRERAAAGGLLLMVMHAIFGGMVFYLVAKTFISESGLNALYFHFPLLGLTGHSYFSILISGTLLVLIAEIIALFWLFLPAKNINHLSQTINLYAGIFSLDFLLVTAMVTLYSSGTGSTFIMILAILFLLIWFGAFYLAAYNSSQSMGNRRIIYLILTIVLYTISFIALLVILTSNEHITQTLELAVSL